MEGVHLSDAPCLSKLTYPCGGSVVKHHGKHAIQTISDRKLTAEVRVPCVASDVFAEGKCGLLSHEPWRLP